MTWLARALLVVAAAALGAAGAAALRSAAAAAAVAGAVLGGALALAAAYLGATLARGRAAAPAAAQARSALVDTSALIDGRIADVAEAGFLDGPLIVPGFVLRELQRIADAQDPLRRNRGRRGFDVLARLRAASGITVTVDETDVPAAREVDDKLVERARALGARVLTTDYNLNRVADLHGIRVLNVNDLANALRPVVLPGEPMQVQLVREGKEAAQGVAFLDDGTMVVVEQGKRFIGQSIDVIVTSVLQTSAGRMVFARLRSEESAGTRDA